MANNQHSIGFYILESYRLNKDMLNLREQKRYVQTPTEHFCILDKIATTSSEIHTIQERISASIDTRKINRAERLAALSQNCASVAALLLKKLNIQKHK